MLKSAVVKSAARMSSAIKVARRKYGGRILRSNTCRRPRSIAKSDIVRPGVKGLRKLAVAKRAAIAVRAKGIKSARHDDAGSSAVGIINLRRRSHE